MAQAEPSNLSQVNTLLSSIRLIIVSFFFLDAHEIVHKAEHELIFAISEEFLFTDAKLMRHCNNFFIRPLIHIRYMRTIQLDVFVMVKGSGSVQKKVALKT